jgi:hypothetical protein
MRNVSRFRTAKIGADAWGRGKAAAVLPVPRHANKITTGKVHRMPVIGSQQLQQCETFLGEV